MFFYRLYSFFFTSIVLHFGVYLDVFIEFLQKSTALERAKQHQQPFAVGAPTAGSYASNESLDHGIYKDIARNTVYLVEWTDGQQKRLKCLLPLSHSKLKRVIQIFKNN